MKKFITFVLTMFNKKTQNEVLLYNIKKLEEEEILNKTNY
uniref:Uncharacterized protein n=1 Tax=Virus NIOZ-UU157 TaxID=2763269 RepID=A0A7S9STH8_9VIRU|nr:MAG: hypothetical protein NIOZUU157_00052 [Virus NIOZ-UU157]